MARWSVIYVGIAPSFYENVLVLGTQFGRRVQTSPINPTLSDDSISNYKPPVSCGLFPTS